MDISAFTALDTNAKVGYLTKCNTAYRQGDFLINDSVYDDLLSIFAKESPSHAYVNSVESEVLMDGKGRVNHPKPMLSTDKAYSWDEVLKWLTKVESLASERGSKDHVCVRVTPKLDGCAGRYSPQDSARFVTRGDGKFGNDFTALGNQLSFIGNKNEISVGEVICDEDYYQRILKPQDVKHPRSFVAGLISADNLSAIGTKALEDGAVHFVSYHEMAGTKIFTAAEFKALGNALDDLESEVTSNCPYRTDGIVLQIDNNAMFSELGHNGSFHYGQVAKKIAGEPIETIVENITYGVGRTGRLTPICNVETVEIDGVQVSNVTAHHAGNVKAIGLGQGAVIQLIRSGSVIPKIVGILKRSVQVDIPEQCPECNGSVKWVNDFLECVSVKCDGKTAAHLQFFTKTLNWDLVGTKAAMKMARAGVDATGLLSIDHAALVGMGFGQGQSTNIIAERERVFASVIEDAKLLASVGIRMLGQRASRALLKEKPLCDVQLFTVNEIASIEGFAEKKAVVIERGLSEQRDLIDALSLVFTNVQSSQIDITESPITGKTIVFTGAMEQGNRTEMSKHAESLGAKVGSSVTGKTDYLVAGLKVGASKLDKATKLNVTILSEQGYIDLVS